MARLATTKLIFFWGFTHIYIYIANMFLQMYLCGSSGWQMDFLVMKYGSGLGSGFS